MQRQMPFFAVIKPPKNAPDSTVRRVETEGQAVAVSLSACGLKHSYVAANMGRSAPWLSRVKSGALAMSDAQAVRFCEVTGSALLLQVRALKEAMAEINGQIDAAAVIRRLAAELRVAA